MTLRTDTAALSIFACPLRLPPAETFRASFGVDLLPSTPLERAEISIFVSQVRG